MLKATEVTVPEDFAYQLRFDFSSWWMRGQVDPSLFPVSPLRKDAKKFTSIQEYYESIAGVTAEHPLLGKPAPKFTATTLAGEALDSNDLQGKVVILDFWATWCEPCVASIPLITKLVRRKYERSRRCLFTRSTRERRNRWSKALSKHSSGTSRCCWIRTEGVAEAFRADAIPQTVIIGKGGAIESVHIGFTGEEQLRKRLTEELDVLSRRRPDRHGRAKVSHSRLYDGTFRPSRPAATFRPL